MKIEQQIDPKDLTRSKKERYYLDERVGCMAIRDRTKDDPNESGLHSDTEGVITFYEGTLVDNGNCPTCQQRRPTVWNMPELDKIEARKWVGILNNLDGA